jgi:hypothetical protein
MLERFTQASGAAVADRKPFLLRLDPAIYAAVEGWAADELRSLNAQIEYVLRRALREAGRLRRPASEASREDPASPAHQ